MSSVNWETTTAGSFVQIEEGKPKTMVLKNWKPQERFKDEKTGEIRPGVVFEVWKEDNLEFDETSKKDWTVTAKGALGLLRPICEKAEATGKLECKVSVVAVGKGVGRKYSITEA